MDTIKLNRTIHRELLLCLSLSNIQRDRCENLSGLIFI